MNELNDEKKMKLEKLRSDLNQDAALLDKLKKAPEEILKTYGLLPEDVSVETVSGGTGGIVIVGGQPVQKNQGPQHNPDGWW